MTDSVGLQPQTAFRNIIEVADSIVKITSGTAYGAPSSSPRCTVAAETFHDALPSVSPPVPLYQVLISDGVPRDAAQKLSALFDGVSKQLYRDFESGFYKTWTKVLSVPTSSSSLSQEELRLKLWRTHAVLYQRKVDDWANTIRSQAASRIATLKSIAPKPKTVEEGRPAFNHDYLPLLEACFAENQRPSRADKCFLAKKSGMAYKQIHVWFQNRRSRTRKAARTSEPPPCVEPAANYVQVLGGCEGTNTDLQKPDVRSPDGNPKCTSRSSSVTSDGNSATFAYRTPLFAFPSRYPPDLEPHKDPFPCRFGDFSDMARIQWGRVPATKIRCLETPEVDSLTAAFGKLSIGGTLSTGNTDRVSLPWGLYSPRGKTGCDVTEPYTVRPLRAPLPSFVQCPEGQRSKTSTDDSRLVMLDLSSSHEKFPRVPRHSAVRPGRPMARGRNSTMPFITRVAMPSSKLLSPALPPLSSITTPALASARPGRPRKSSRSVQFSPSGLAAGQDINSTLSAAQTTYGLSPEPSVHLRSTETMNSSFRILSSDPSESPPPLTHSSSSSSASSETHSPLTPFDIFPDEESSFVHDNSAIADLSMPHTPPSVSMPNKYSPSLLKGLSLGAFGYDLPTFQSFLQPMDALPLDLRLPYDSATLPPYPYDFSCVVSQPQHLA